MKRRDMPGFTSWGCGKTEPTNKFAFFYDRFFPFQREILNWKRIKLNLELNKLWWMKVPPWGITPSPFMLVLFFYYTYSKYSCQLFFRAIIHRLLANCVNYNHLHYLILNFIYCVCVWMSSCIYSCYNVFFAIIICNVDSIFTTNNLNYEL